MDQTLYFCLSFLEREDIIFLQMWEGTLKCLFRFLLRSEVTKGLNFILAAGASAVVIVLGTFLKEERCILTGRLLVVNHVKSQRSRSEDFGTGPCIARAPVVH